MGEKQKSLKNLWVYGATYLGIIGLWWLTTAGWFGFENWRSYYRFAELMIIKSGLMALLFVGRYLIFSGYRSWRVFGWTLGGAIFTLIAMKIGIGSEFFLGMVQLAELGDGLIWCLFGAWLLEMIGALYREWFRAPIDALSLPGLKRRFGSTIVKLGLWNAGVICFLELYWLNVLAVEMIPAPYLLLTPFLGVSIGLYGVFALRLNRWSEERIGVVDGQLLALVDWESGGARESLIGLTPGEIERTQLLLLWRRYLADLKKPAFTWWVLGVYLVLIGLIISLPDWISIVLEV